MIKKVFLAGMLAVLAANAMAEDSRQVVVDVQGANDEWTSLGFKVHRGDLLVVDADGNVVLGQFSGPSNPQGQTTGLGRLQIKVGSGAPYGVGAQGHYWAEQDGTVKVRVYDTKYGDNSGAYHVRVLYVPASAIPAPQAPPSE